jgi:hypothetical protein
MLLSQMYVKTADCVVFVSSPVSPKYMEIADRTRTVLVEYDSTNLSPQFINKYHASTQRWILFHQFFSQIEATISGKYDKMMFADARDVAFEDDPFYRVPPNTSIVFQEGLANGNPISGCGWNSGWIKDCMGPKILDAVQKYDIICSGVSFTSYLQGRAYLKLMSTIMLGESDMSRYFPTCERNGVDQGVHNVIVHLGLMQNVEFHSDMDFPLVNIQNSQMWNRAGLKLSELLYSTVVVGAQTDTKYAVIHQFDRISSLTLELARKYVYWKSYDNVVTMWRNEPRCAKYNTFIGDDLFKGQCDVGSARVFTAEQCCGLCNELSKCTGFAFSDSVCYYKSCERATVSKETLAAMDAAAASPKNLHNTVVDPELRIAPDSILMTAFT